MGPHCNKSGSHSLTHQQADRLYRCWMSLSYRCALLFLETSLVIALAFAFLNIYRNLSAINLSAIMVTEVSFAVLLVCLA